MNITSKESKNIAHLLRERKETISVAESSIGGLLSASLLAIPGASDYFMGGAVIYTMRARRRLLGISKEILDSQEPLTEQYATLLADATRAQLKSDWAIAELGATGPAGTPYGHPPGICVLAVTGSKTLSRYFETKSNNREQNMVIFLAEALNLLHEALSK
ncbi:MAG: CinA family protein [Pseudomonadota bacterium]|nr:CinA family protein [Pseudomonadota bacterium]